MKFNYINQGENKRWKVDLTEILIFAKFINFFDFYNSQEMKNAKFVS